MTSWAGLFWGAALSRPVPPAAVEDKGVTVPATFEAARMVAGVAEASDAPALGEALRLAGARSNQIDSSHSTAAEIRKVFQNSLMDAGPRDLVVLMFSGAVTTDGGLALLGVDARVSGGRLRGVISAAELEDLLLASPAGRVLLLVAPRGATGQRDALDRALSELAAVRAGVYAAQVPDRAALLCVPDTDGDGQRTLAELAQALGGAWGSYPAQMALPWAADRCAAPAPVTICLQQDGRPVPPTHAFAPGATFGLTVATPPPGYLYLTQGGVLVYPADLSAPLRAPGAHDVTLPANPSEVLRLDGATQTETLSLLWSAAPIADAETLARRAWTGASDPGLQAAQAKGAQTCGAYVPVGDERGWGVTLNLNVRKEL